MTRHRIPRFVWLLGALYLGLALMLVQVHAYQVNFGPRAELRVTRHDAVLTGRGHAPWTYRVLMPALVEVTRAPLERVFPPKAALEVGYLWWRFVATLGFLCLFHVFLRNWLDPPWAIAGTLLAAALHPATYRFYWFQPDSPTDLVIWIAAALLTLHRRDGWLVPLVLIGSLNRETAVFAVVIHAALRYGHEPTSRLVARSVGLVAVWAVPFFGIRMLVGAQPWAADVAGLVRANLGPGWLAYALAFLGGLLIVPFVGWRRRPVELRRLALALLLTYVPLQLVFGRIREVRLLLPLAIPLVPLALLAVREAVSEDQAA